MLAPHKSVAIEEIVFPAYISPKLDGVRAFVWDGKIMSRKFEPFPLPYVHQLFDNVLFNRFDGELIVGNVTNPQTRNLTSGSLNAKDDRQPDLWFHLFDIIDTVEPFKDRYRALEKIVRHYGEKNRIKLVEHRLVHNAIDVLEFEKDCLEMGYEGCILRDPDGKYKHGRGTLKERGMLKLKRFEDAEAQVLRVNEEMRNTNPAEKDALGHTKRSKAQEGLVGKGRAGELEVRDLNGPFAGVEHVVPLGAAGDKGKAWWWEHRNDDPLPVITYKFFNHGVKDKPLLPTYVGVRPEWDRS